MKISGNMTMTKFDAEVTTGEPIAICLHAHCRGVVRTAKGAIPNGICEKCGEDYEVSFIAVLKVAE